MKALGKSRHVNSKDKQGHEWKMEHMKYLTQNRTQDKNVPNTH